MQTVRDELDGSVQQVIRLVESLTYSEARLHHKGIILVSCFKFILKTSDDHRR